jgi:CRP-like cAMP-binding protein
MLNLTDLTNTIKSIPWFHDLKPESIQRLTSIAEIVAFLPDEIIFTEGEKHDYFYIILEGKVCVEGYVPGYGSLPIFTAESLDVVGSSSLTPVIRQKTGTARVSAPARLLAFKADALMDLCEADNELGFTIMRRLANIVASRMLTQRLHLLELISDQQHRT